MRQRNRKNRNGGRDRGFNQTAEDRWFDDGGNEATESSSYRGERTPGGYYSGRQRNQGSWQTGVNYDRNRGYGQEENDWQHTQNWTTSGMGHGPGGTTRFGRGQGQSNYGQLPYGQSGYQSEQNFQGSDFGDYSRTGAQSGGMGNYGHPGNQQNGNYGREHYQGGFGGPSSGSYGWGQHADYEGSYRSGGSYGGAQHFRGAGEDTYGTYAPSRYGRGEEGGFGTSCPYCSNQQANYGREPQSVSNWGTSQPGGFFAGQQYGGGGYYAQPRGAYGRETSGRSSDYSSEGWYGESSGTSQRPFANRGPKGYKRSDERIQDDVNDALSEGTIDASEITVKVQNGEVTLTGSVPDRHTKFMAESLAENVLGVGDVANQLKVNRSSGATTSSDYTRSGASGSSGTRETNNDDSQSGGQRSPSRTSVPTTR